MIWFNVKKFLIIVFIIICPLLFVNIQRNWVEDSFLFRSVATVTGAIRKTYSSYVHSIKNTLYLYLSLIQVKKNNIFLQQENARLKTKLLQMEELQIKNQQLTKMLQFKNRHYFDLLSVRVIGRDPFPEYHLITVDKGRQNGVKKNMLALVE